VAAHLSEAEQTRLRELPPRGWTQPGEILWCDACDRRIWYWELHHLDPKGWGGNPSQKLEDRQVVWVRLDGDCHATAHMILDRFKADGIWSEQWCRDMELPHAIVEVARRGWNLSQKRLQEAAGGP
jgi:hypothetical protein